MSSAESYKWVCLYITYHKNGEVELSANKGAVELGNPVSCGDCDLEEAVPLFKAMLADYVPRTQPTSQEKC